MPTRPFNPSRSLNAAIGDYLVETLAPAGLILLISTLPSCTTDATSSELVLPTADDPSTTNEESDGEPSASPVTDAAGIPNAPSTDVAVTDPDAGSGGAGMGDNETPTGEPTDSGPGNESGGSGASDVDGGASAGDSGPGGEQGVGGSPSEVPGRVMLFNSADLSNWTVTLAQGDARGVTAEDEFFDVTTLNGEPVIRAYPNTPADATHSGWATLVSGEQFERYHLHLEYKWGETMYQPYANPTQRRRDSGLLYHIEDPEQLRRNRWPISLEYQLMEGRLSCDVGCYDSLTGDFFGLSQSGQSYTSGGHFLPEAEGGTLGPARRARLGAVDKIDDWNVVEVIIDGAERGDYYLNGELINQVFNTSASRGHIGVQAESAEVYFRNFWLDPIDDNTPVQ